MGIVMVSTTSQPISVGQTISFDVRVEPNGAENIAAAQLAIRFDPDVLEVVNVTHDVATLPIPIGSPAIENGDGTAFFPALTFTPLSADQAPFRFATIEFKAIGLPDGGATQVVFEVDLDRKTAVVNAMGEIVLNEAQDYSGARIEIVP